VSSVLRPHQHSIGYMGDGFYRSRDPTNSIKVLKKLKQSYRKFLMEIHLRIMGCRLPYGITQYYLPPDTSEHTSP